MSSLLNDILYLILLHLDFILVVRYSILLKRWIDIYKKLPFMSLSPSSILGDCGYELGAKHRVESVIYNFVKYRFVDLPKIYLQNETKSSWNFSPFKA